MTYIWYLLKKSKFSFYFIIFRRLSVNQLTMLQAESQEYKRRYSSICDRISGSIHSHGDLQIKEVFSASKCETSDIISDVIYVSMTLRT